MGPPCLLHMGVAEDDFGPPVGLCCGCFQSWGNTTATPSTSTDEESRRLLFSILFGMARVMCLVTSALLHSKSPPSHRHELLLVNDLTPAEISVLREKEAAADARAAEGV